MTIKTFMDSFPPMPTSAEMKRFKESVAGNLAAVTVCECGKKEYLHRLGCSCGGQIRLLWQDSSGSLIERGIDFSFINYGSPRNIVQRC